MGEELKLNTLYMTDKEGNKTELGRIKEVKSNEIESDNKNSDNINIATHIPASYEGSIDYIISNKAISKKRFIKLLMGKHKIQRNEAIKIHNEFMKEHKKRTVIDIGFYLMVYSVRKFGITADKATKNLKKLRKVVNEYGDVKC